ncbi:MAG: ATP-dependent Clp protease adaptor ClpS [Bacteroidetes bacterium]|nr:ATP-dependent Clp protease adaptor ClpS [Bacteroidota bacterium]
MNAHQPDRLTKEQYDVDVLEEEGYLSDLIVYNDDVNTFDHVIKCLIDICGHDAVQAEQCSIIIHYKGKCGVKRGEYEELRVMCEGLVDKGLSATIE